MQTKWARGNKSRRRRQGSQTNSNNTLRYSTIQQLYCTQLRREDGQMPYNEQAGKALACGFGGKIQNPPPYRQDFGSLFISYCTYDGKTTMTKPPRMNSNCNRHHLPWHKQTEGPFTVRWDLSVLGTDMMIFSRQ